MKCKFLILGGGPAGLTFANKIKEYGEDDFILLEQESEAGGLCRSVDVDGSPLDIGGGHFLDTSRHDVNDFLFHFMPEDEWNMYDRDSRIDLGDSIISHPIEANIWQLNEERQQDYLRSIAAAGCNNGEKEPALFVQWIYWKLGERISDDYMIPYNQKMFGDNLNELGTYWLEKLPNVKYEETLLSCRDKKPYGKQPGHAKFYYPKRYGYGELWKRMASCLEDKIIYNSKVVKLDVINKEVTVENGEVYKADTIITTIPWLSIDALTGVPEHIIDSVTRLKHTGIEVRYCPENLNTEAHWIYYPNKNLPYHRILVRHNFCDGSRGYWTETNLSRILSESCEESSSKFINNYAYPLNTIDKPNIMSDLLRYCSEYMVYGLGRWGEHQHYNSDVTVQRAMELARGLTYRISTKL